MNDRLDELTGVSDRSSWSDEDVESGLQPSVSDDDDERSSKQKKRGLKGMKRKKRRSLKVRRKISVRLTNQMDAFFRDVESIKASIEAIAEATKKIRELNDAAALATTDGDEAGISNEMRAVVDATNKKAKRTKDLLGSMKDENAKLKEEKGKIKASDLQVRENLCYTLTQKFVEELKHYQRAQRKYKDDVENKAKRQIRILNPDATDEEVGTILRSEGGREGFYKNAILADRVSSSVKAAYTDVANKYNDIRILEQSVSELHQMFLDLALLTEQQGEMLDHIEHQVTSAADYVEEGNDEVYKAIQIQKKIRKKHCFIILIVIIILVIVVVVPLL